VRRTISLALLVATGMLAIPPASAQEVTFPASAVIRGENVRLRAEPSFDAEELEILQRGDAVTITGEPVAAEGDEFYPVDFAKSGESGWVRTVFINPDSLIVVQVLEPANEGRQNRRNQGEETPVEQTGGEQGGASANEETRAERRARRQAERDAAAQEGNVEQVNNPVPVEQTPAEDEPAELQPVEEPGVAAGDPAEAVTISGEGSGTTDPVALIAGDYQVTITSEISAPSDVVVRLIDADETAQRLFRESVGAQSWTAETDVTIEADGDYTVRVSGLDDAWTLTFTPIPA
jgi:virulence-associated protein VagC